MTVGHDVMASVVYLSKEKFNALKSELKKLKDERPWVAQQIADAKEKGDLSENAEYDAAKEAQRILERKIFKLETMIKNSEVVDNTNRSTDSVVLFSNVTLKSLNNNFEVMYTIVSEEEANIMEKKIAISSPLGKELFGKKKGDVVIVKAPVGTLSFEILDIQ